MNKFSRAKDKSIIFYRYNNYYFLNTEEANEFITYVHWDNQDILTPVYFYLGRPEVINVPLSLATNELHFYTDKEIGYLNE